jgi:exonuclease SbcD
MTKIIAFSDFHAHIFNDYAKPDPEYVNDRFRAQMETLEEVFSIAREEGATVLFAGDLFHKRSKIDDIVFNSVYKVFAENPDVHVTMVRGNHDARTNATVTAHWLETFKYLPNVTVYDVPDFGYVEAGDSRTGDGFDIYAIPYSDDTAFLKQEIAKFAEMAKQSNTPSVLVGHIGVDGSEVGQYSHRLEGAFKVGDLFPDVFDYVLLGHYHKRQFLAGLDNVCYIGNTIQTSFSDEGQEKGVMLLDTDKKTKPEFIPIKNKQFITLTEITADTQDIIDNNYVRFILPKEQAQEVEIFKESTDNIRVEIQREYNVETRINIDRESTEEQIVEAYAKERYPESLEVALDIIREAKLATSN